jgi:uncharacterized protein YceK
MYRIFVILVVAVLLGGCAHMKTTTREGGEVRYTGTARGASELLYATDPTPGRAMEIAEMSVDSGQPVSVRTDNVSLQSGYTYGYGGMMIGGPTASGLPVGYMATSASPLPQLGTPVVQSQGAYVDGPSVGAKCPDDGVPKTPAEERACLRDDVDFVIDQIRSP